MPVMAKITTPSRLHNVTAYKFSSNDAGETELLLTEISKQFSQLISKQFIIIIISNADVV